MLPSDIDYTPAATNAQVVESTFYRKLLKMNTDPYAPHSYDKGLIETVEELAFCTKP